MTKLTAKNWKKEFELKGFKNKLMGILIEWFGSEAKYQKEWAERIVKIHKEVLQTVVKDLAGEETLDAWCSAIHYSELGKGKLDKKVMVNHYNQHRQEVLERGKKWIETKH